MGDRQLRQQTFPAPGELDDDLSPVGGVRRAPHEPARLHPIDELDRAVMPELQPLGEPADGGGDAGRHAAQRKQELVLLRLEARLPGRLLAEAEEAPELVPELRQGAVIRGSEALHDPIIYRGTI